VGGLPEVLGDAARWVPPGDPDALRAAILEVLADPLLRGRLSLAGRRRAPRFDLAVTAAGWRAAARGVHPG
jgi:glycosyltransferase involved in cell wall biosynthesis